MKVVQTLRQRIDEHESELSQSEAQTRYALVDPLLRALGWDVEDPKQVTVEYPVDVGTQRDGKVDYTLFVDEKREVVIEAKRFNTLQSESMFENKPEDDIVAKGIRYCAKDGIINKTEEGGTFTIHLRFTQEAFFATSQLAMTSLDLARPRRFACSRRSRLDGDGIHSIS